MLYEVTSIPKFQRIHNQTIKTSILGTIKRLKIHNLHVEMNSNIKTNKIISPKGTLNFIRSQNPINRMSF